MPRRNLTLLLVITAVSLLCYRKAETFSGEQGRMLETLARAMNEVEDRYIEKVERRELFDAAMRGMLRKLDENSDYFPPEEYARFREMLDQQFGGIGVFVREDEKTKALAIISPLPGSPAYEKGLRHGDLVLAIDGHSTIELGSEAARDLIRGEPGSAVRLRIRAAADEQERDVDVTRAIIRPPSVRGDRYNDDGTWNFLLESHPQIGLVRIPHEPGFGAATAAELAAALKSLQERGAKGVILDVRGNPGGLLDSAVQVCDLFIAEGVIVSTRSRQGQGLDKVYRAKPDGDFRGIPMVVLIDGGSASASEIVAACLQDHGRAYVVGERSYGKGSVQSVIDLEHGKSAIKFTVSSYWRPNNKNIQKPRNAKETDVWGVMPDLVVPLDGDALRKVIEARFERDIFRPGQQPPATGAVDAQLEAAIKRLEDKIKK
ncbi:MAG: S41 family peptidase [Planctomycetia bacterium]|nr:S41 family peptidase [Planctomycetia bacterium]